MGTVQGLGSGLEGADWLGINWNGGNGPPQDYTKTINLNTISGDKLYLNWRMKYAEGHRLVNRMGSGSLMI